jgi:hypothetical protein
MKKALVLVPIVALLTACSGMQTLQTENLDKKQVPTWYLEHADTGKEGWIWNREGMFYAVAQDVSPDMEMALKKATLKAKAKIADRVVGEMTNRTTIKYDESGTPDKPVGFGQAQDVIVNLIPSTPLQTYGIEKKQIIFNPEFQNYRSFVLMKISKKDVDTLITRYNEQAGIKLQGRVAGKNIDETAKEVLDQAKQ